MSVPTDLPRVAPLEPTLANQIAAGEVVERPASVLKELLENALDAGAGRVEIDVEQGGVGLLRLRDDGHGVHRDDLALALAPHATSKIRSFEDLLGVSSMGFRGEALPSIASVSRFEISSRTAGSDTGWRLAVEGGRQMADPAPVAHPVGTTVVVRDLFYNTPVRRKFLRTERTESRHLEEVARRIALGRFDLALQMQHGTRRALALRAAGEAGGARVERLAKVCGGAFAEQALEVDFFASGLRLQGWLAGPELSRGHADLQYFFVNGRAVSDRLARHAVRHAYGTLIPPGRHPAFVLYLTLDPESVDVNVHPTKHEVRFREGRMVHDFLATSLTRALAGAGESGAGSAQVAEEQHPVASYRPAPPGPAVPGSRGGAFAGAAAAGGGPGAAVAEAGPLGRPLARVFDGHLLALAGDTLYLIDIQRARAALLSVRFTVALDAGNLHPRPLLIPVSCELAEPVADRVEGAAGLLADMGFDLRRTAPGGVALRGIPALLADVAPAGLLAALVDTLGTVAAERGPVPAALFDALLDRLDLVAGPVWNDAQLAALLRGLEAEEIGSPDARGRARWLRWTRRQIEGALAGSSGHGGPPPLAE